MKGKRYSTEDKIRILLQREDELKHSFPVALDRLENLLNEIEGHTDVTSTYASEGSDKFKELQKELIVISKQLQAIDHDIVAISPDR